jgi:hypothetical protein
MNERPEPGTPNYDDLYKSMSAEGYKNNNYVLVGINHRGEPHIIEGNHRAAVARDLGVKSIPAKFHWFAGGEQADGFKPEHIKSLMPDITKAEGGEVDTNRNAAFKGLASAQRGDPEMAMVKAQVSLGKLKKSGTSVLSSLLEHVGDLTHRISEYPTYQPSLALENAPPKIKKALMALRPYRRDRMDLEDHVPSDMPELKEYADAHAALPAYNDMQRHARDAAVALGNKDFNAANAHLTKLHDAISDGSFGNRIMEFNSPIAKAEGGPVDDPSDPDYHAKVHQDLMWHSAHNRSSNYGAALYHHLMKQPDQGPITKFYEQTVYPILKNHGFPKPPEGPGDVENPKYLQAVSDVVKNWRDVPRNKEDVHKAEGGPVAAPVGGFPGMKAMPTLSAPQNSQATQAMMAAIPRMQESGPVSNTGYAPYTPTALPQRLAAIGVQPKVVPMSAEVAALKKQFPTATMDQLSEYNRAIADGGDPKATLSLMKAYSPASNYTSHQPWSPDFKGFDYKRSRPTDEFGNPVGWTPTAEDEASRQKSLAVSGGKAGYAPLDFPDQYRPDDEYILNNPWTYGMDSLGGNVMPGEIGTRASERSSQGPTVVDANASYQEGKKAAADAAISKIESMYNPENIGALGPVDANQARMDAVTRAAQTQGMGAARSLGGDSLPGRQSSYFSTPDNFTLNNAIQTGFSALGVTPLAPLGYLANAFLTGTNAIPQAGDTGNRALNAIAQQGRMTDWGADAVNWGWRQLGGEAMPARATGGRTQACKEARKAIMIAKAMGGRIGKADGGGIDDAAPVPAPVTKGPKTVFTYGRSSISETKNPKRIMFTSDAPGKVKGIVTPRHMWEGGNGKGGIHIPGMEEINEARANVYGAENREPLTVGKMANIHQNTLAEHFQKPLQQQMADESAALGRLRAAMHIGKTANTLDESEKLDTVRHEYDDQGRSYLAYGAKGTAGHTVYTSGHGDNRKFHVVNTCAGQTGGCGGGVDKNGIVDTSGGACFAPNAEAQYVGAAVRRAAHEQAKFDPAMTQDWVLAHTGSLRAAANKSDKYNKVTLFRPNIVDETDRSTRHVIRGLNKQRLAEGKPAIIANSYGKTAELHDPENGYFVTYSNTGPKTKLGASIAENISRDKSRVHATVMANEASGKDYVNEDGNLTPPKNSYAVTDVQRGSDLDKRMQGAFTHVKYWTAGRSENSLSPEEMSEGAEGHYDGSGNPTSPDASHYGHATLNGMRYDYQRQHILHPRLVHVGENKDRSPHMIPTDSRFKDDDYLPKDRFMTKNGKQAGAVLLTTPTTSTSSIGHQSSFTHHVDDANISHALDNNGEYEIDPPAQQQASAGNEYKPPKGKETYARGGLVTHDENGDLLTGFPEQSFVAQRHNSHRLEDKNNNAKGERPTQYAYGGPVDGDRQLGLPVSQNDASAALMIARAMGGRIAKAGGGELPLVGPTPDMATDLPSLRSQVPLETMYQGEDQQPSRSWGNIATPPANQENVLKTEAVAPVYTSRVHELLTNPSALNRMKMGRPQQWVKYLQKGGAKPDEINMYGIGEGDPNTKISRDEVHARIDGKIPQLREKLLGQGGTGGGDLELNHSDWETDEPDDDWLYENAKDRRREDIRLNRRDPDFMAPYVEDAANNFSRTWLTSFNKDTFKNPNEHDPEKLDAFVKTALKGDLLSKDTAEQLHNAAQNKQITREQWHNAVDEMNNNLVSKFERGDKGEVGDHTHHYEKAVQALHGSTDLRLDFSNLLEEAALDDDSALDKHVDQEREWYYQDSDSPKSKSISVSNPKGRDLNYDIRSTSGYGGDIYVWDHRGNPIGNVDSEDEAEELIRSHAAKQLGLSGTDNGQKNIDKPNVHDVGVYGEGSKYSLPGVTDYREHTLHFDPPTGKDFTEGHYDPNAVVHMRYGTVHDANGKRLLYLDELQSDWHQKGMGRGYDTPEGREAKSLVKIKHDKATQELDAHRNHVASGLGFSGSGSGVDRYAGLMLLDPNDKSVIEDWRKGEAVHVSYNSTARVNPDLARAMFGQNAEDLNAQQLLQNFHSYSRDAFGDNYRRVASDLNSALEKQSNLYEAVRGNLIPDAPWKNTSEWSKLAMKRALRIAADYGYDGVALSPGWVQKHRWGNEDHQKTYDDLMGGSMKSLAKQEGMNFGTASIPLLRKHAQNNRVSGVDNL